MTTMATGNEQQPHSQPNRRTPSLANLLHPPPTDLDKAPLLSLSHLASTMQPAPSPDRRRLAAATFARSTHLPTSLQQQRIQHPDDRRRETDNRPSAGLSRSTSGIAPSLGVRRNSAKRLSRTKSAAYVGRLARGIAADHPAPPRSDTSDAPLPALPTTPQTPGHKPLQLPVSPHAHAALAAMPSPAGTSPGGIVRVGGSPGQAVYGSKRSSASNSVESCVPGGRREVFPVGSGRVASTVDFASHALARMRAAGRKEAVEDVEMEIETEQREPSWSSHDMRMGRGRGRTTPDAKRAQNRESAKRFRVAQKKRWAEMIESCERKDLEIDRLKGMLQEVTNRNIGTVRKEGAGSGVKRGEEEKADALTMAELDLFVKLMGSKREHEEGGGSVVVKKDVDVRPPMAANIGSLYRVIVAKLDGSVLGVRHENDSCGKAMGGEVGGCIWEQVHGSDVAHLRFTVVHAAKMASVLEGEPTIFSYRRRAVPLIDGKLEQEGKEVQWMRMKGCLYPLADENGDVNSVILAEFVEIN